MNPRYLILSTLSAAALLAGCAVNQPGVATTNDSSAAQFAPLPEAVTSFGAVARDGWLYVCGGHKGERHEYSAEMVSGSFYRIRLSDGGRWESLPATEPAQGAPLVAHGQFIYRIGGMAARNHVGETNEIFSKTLATRFDLKRDRWEPIHALPEPRSSHDALIVENKLYVAGGWQLSGSMGRPKWHSTMLVLDLDDPRGQWQSRPQPFQRRALAMAALESRLFFIGGMDADNKTTSAVEILDLKTGEWSKGPDLPEGPMKGFGCSAIEQDGRLFVSTYSGGLFELTKDGQRWDKVGELQHARFFHRLVPCGRTRLVAVGGEGEDGKLNDLELLSPIKLAKNEN